MGGADWAPCDSAVQYSGLALGDYTFSVRAVDAAGNPDGSPATYERLARRGAARDDDRHRSRVRHHDYERELHVLLRPARLELRVLAGPGRVRRVRLAARDHGHG